MKKFLLITLTPILFLKPSDIKAQAGNVTFLRDSSVWRQWDSASASWKLNLKYEYLYDADQNVVRKKNRGWDTTQWTPGYTEYLSYDAHGNNTEILSQLWNAGTYKNNSHRYKVYDTHGNEIEETSQDWYDTAWVNSGRLIAVFDTVIDKRTGYITQRWDSVWQNYSRYSFTYDTSGFMTSILIEMWDSSTWKNQQMGLYTNDVNGNQIESVSLWWNSNAWDSSFKSINTFDPNNNQTSSLSKMWIGSSWLDDENWVRTYDANNNETYQLIQLFTSGNWVNNNQSFLTYDTDTNIISTVNQDWKYNTWRNADSIHFYYHSITSGNCSAALVIFPDSLQLHHYWALNQSTGSGPLNYEWTWGDGTSDTAAYPSHTYDTAGFYTICLSISDSAGCRAGNCYNYILQRNRNAMVYVDVISEIPTGITQNFSNQALFILSPNPTNSSFTIHLNSQSEIRNSQLEIYNTLGEKIYAAPVNKKQETINCNRFAAGIYVVKVSDGERAYMQKLVVR